MFFFFFSPKMLEQLSFFFSPPILIKNINHTDTSTDGLKYSIWKAALLCALITNQC